MAHFNTQGVHKLVILKFAVVMSELDVTIWSGAFVARSPQAIMQTARLHSIHAKLLRNPAGPRGVMYWCRACTVLFVFQELQLTTYVA